MDPINKFIKILNNTENLKKPLPEKQSKKSLTEEMPVKKQLKQYIEEATIKKNVQFTSPELQEKLVIAIMKKKQQPTVVYGSGYSYHCNMIKNPLTWIASDGSVIKLKNLKELGEYAFDTFSRGSWNILFKPVPKNYAKAEIEVELEDLINEGMIKFGRRPPAGQEEYELGHLRGDW